MNQTNCSGFLNGKHCKNYASLLYENTPYCAKHYNIVITRQKNLTNRSNNEK